MKKKSISFSARLVEELLVRIPSLSHRDVVRRIGEAIVIYRDGFGASKAPYIGRELQADFESVYGALPTCRTLKTGGPNDFAWIAFACLKTILPRDALERSVILSLCDAIHRAPVNSGTAALRRVLLREGTALKERLDCITVATQRRFSNVDVQNIEETNRTGWAERTALTGERLDDVLQRDWVVVARDGSRLTSERMGEIIGFLCMAFVRTEDPELPVRAVDIPHLAVSREVAVRAAPGKVKLIAQCVTSRKEYIRSRLGRRMLFKALRKIRRDPELQHTLTESTSPVEAGRSAEAIANAPQLLSRLVAIFDAMLAQSPVPFTGVVELIAESTPFLARAGLYRLADVSPRCPIEWFATLLSSLSTEQRLESLELSGDPLQEAEALRYRSLVARICHLTDGQLTGSHLAGLYVFWAVLMFVTSGVYGRDGRLVDRVGGFHFSNGATRLAGPIWGSRPDDDGSFWSGQAFRYGPDYEERVSMYEALVDERRNTWKSDEAYDVDDKLAAEYFGRMLDVATLRSVVPWGAV